MEPITTALAALGVVKQIVNVIKQADSTIQDVSSLGPLLGRYFDKKHEITKSLRETSKPGFKGSNMGRAAEIELELKSMAQFENEMQFIFMTTGNIDVWNKIVARSAAMDEEDRANQRRAADALKQARKKRKENLELGIAITLSTITLVILMWIGIEAIYYCREVKCGA
jgi:hypothetical protein